MDNKTTTPELFADFLEIIKTLRGPNGCPWDREQTPLSIRGDFLEEVYEAIEAIDDNDIPHVREELGDVLLLVTMLAQMYSESGGFDMGDVIAEVSKKLVRRHPHVFGNQEAGSSEEVLKQWDDIKTNIEGRDKGDSVLNKIPGSLPPLERSWKMQKRVSKKGFDWPDISGPKNKIIEELAEIDEARETGDSLNLEEEIGDLLFSVVNYSRHLGVEPALALRRTNSKFEKRFRYVEKRMAEDSKEMKPESIVEMDAYWDESKGKVSL